MSVRTMSQKRKVLTKSSRVIIPLFIVFLQFVVSLSQSDGDILIRFKKSLNNADALSSWENDKPPCQANKEVWNGVLCENGKVWGLQLENMGLGGVIDVATLTEMKNLRALSFMKNNFDGALPDFSKLVGLRSIYLSNNQFSGEISNDTFNGLQMIKKIYLADNKFNGPIPGSFGTLPKLKELTLENNGFEGNVPAFPKDKFTLFNVSNNKLEGKIPDTLTAVNASAFSGNKDLCGPPLEACASPNKLSIVTIVIVCILVAAALAALIAVVIILRRRKKPLPEPESTTTTQDQQTGTNSDLDKVEQGQFSAVPAASSPDQNASVRKAEQSIKLTFLQDDREKFDLPDLLKASAEILGSGVFGSTYKAALNDGHMMVVKRFRHMNNVSKEEFHEHMRRFGRLDHENLLPIVAFYYRKEEKLLVTDFAQNVSLAVHLHGNKSRGQQPPNWPTRLSIIKGVANGLKYLYNELPSITAPHGHLKSSNVLLDRNYKPLLTDYGLVPVVNQEHAQDHMISYKSPEYKHNGRITKKTDVWSLGILILEILTGRFPSNFLQQGRGSDTDITTWVESVVREDSNVEVFDKDMDRSESCENEMMKLLKIGMNCSLADPERRPDIKDVVKKIEEIKERD